MLLVPGEDGGLTLQAYIACFASGFGMRAIFGRDLDGIHAEVPGYGDKIGVSMGRWFARVEAGRVCKRANVSWWGVFLLLFVPFADAACCCSPAVAYSFFSFFRAVVPCENLHAFLNG